MFWSTLGSVAALWALTLVVQAYLKGYGKQKGENLATHEDIQKLVDQVQAVTKATEGIKDEISIKAWARETRKEVAFALIDKLATVDGLFTRFLSTRVKLGDDFLYDKAERDQVASDLGLAFHEFAKTRSLAAIVCGAEVQTKIKEITQKSSILLPEIATKAITPEVLVALMKKLQDFSDEIVALAGLIRRDLNID